MNTMNIFEGKLVRLRAVEASDWEVHFQWNFDTDSARDIDEIWFPQSSGMVRQWAGEQSMRRSENDQFTFVIERSADNQHLGLMSSHSCDLRNGHFCYGLGIRPPHRQKGYASAAILLLLRYFFMERRYNKVNAYVYSFNSASIRLHQSLGYQQEGIIRQRVFSGGAFHDEIIFGLLRDEFIANLLPRME